MQHEMWKVLCLLVGEGTIEQLVDSVVDGGGKYSGELCKLVCRCQLMAVVVTQWQGKCNMNVKAVVYLVVNGSVENEHSGNGNSTRTVEGVVQGVVFVCLTVVN